MFFFATTVNYLDRQVLYLTWSEFIAPEFHWNDSHYGIISSLFSLFYALGMFFARRIVDRLDTKRGHLWTIGIWSVGAVMHAGCGMATRWWVGAESKEALAAISNAQAVSTIIMVSVTLFIIARLVLALGEAGNFPAAIKAVAEYFPNRDRAFATSIFNAGTTVGALVAPVTIPVIAKIYGWEMAFVIIGLLGFIWMGAWVLLYRKPDKDPRVNAAELEYICRDGDGKAEKAGRQFSIRECLRYRQTWAFAFGKFLTDGVWWFLLFWAPRYLESNFGMKTSDPETMLALCILYAITLLAILGGYLPTVIIKKMGTNPYAGRMRAMLIYAFFPVVILFAQPLGMHYGSFWLPIVLIGIAGAAHQSWSANIFTTVYDMFPHSAVGTVTGIGYRVSGIGYRRYGERDQFAYY